MTRDTVPTEELVLGALLARHATAPPAGLTLGDFTGARRDVYRALLAAWEAGEAADVGVVTGRVHAVPVSTLAGWAVAAVDAAVGALDPLVDALHQATLQRLVRPVGEVLARLDGPALATAVATLAEGGALDVLGAATGAPADWVSAVTAGLNGRSQASRGISGHQLLSLTMPPREALLAPLLHEKETAMLHAWRGVGKTHVGIGIAWAVASGGTFLGWRAPRPRRVAYLDGELPTCTLQERFAAAVRATGQDDVDIPEDFLTFCCADLFPGGIPNLATREGQAFVAPVVRGAALVVVDSIATLASSGDENTAESWLPLQAWALGLRRAGTSVLFLHHDGKGGLQRGTSAREDILDLVIGLRRPADYDPSQGARFEVHVEKARGLAGDDLRPLEARLELDRGRAIWTHCVLGDAQLKVAAGMYRDGASASDVASDLKVSRATAFRLRQRAKDAGLL